MFKKGPKKQVFLAVSLFIFLVDGLFVLMNYCNNKATLKSTLYEQALNQKKEFQLALTLTYRNMMQLGLFISQDRGLNQLFYEGKKAVLAEGGGKGGVNADTARQALLKQVKPAWDELTKAYAVRQLHYHIGPGSLSFLRVHKPRKYGDRMDKLRHIIVDVNQQKVPMSGFETGRIYSGLRAVYPIFSPAKENQASVHVGAVEVGTSFKQLLPIVAKTYNTQFAVLLDKAYANKKMWPEFVKEYFGKHPDLSFFIEASSSKEIPALLKKLTINPPYKLESSFLVPLNNKTYNVYYFPIRDYQATTNKNLDNGGVVLLWHDVTPLVTQFNKSTLMNIIYGIIGFILVEAAILWLLYRERRFAIIKKQALRDSLTGLYNRRAFDEHFKQMLTQADIEESPLSLIVCDVDLFKQFNDCYGHQAGDQCLKYVAKILGLHFTRPNDVVARYGGEEFAIILPNTSLKDAVSMAQSLCDTVSNSECIATIPTQAVKITVSCGVACTEQRSQNQSLFDIADGYLYKAKNKGRNCVVYH